MTVRFGRTHDKDLCTLGESTSEENERGILENPEA
jgi:hypothetical protein